MRKAGDQVRITAQLIKSADGTHLSTESYDRKLTDIFAVQEDIATAIAGALQVPLGLKQGQNLVSNRTTDARILRGLSPCQRARARPDTIITSAITLLEQVITRDPNYAPTWAQLASAYALLPGYSSSADATGDERRRFFANDLPKAEAAAQKPSPWMPITHRHGQRSDRCSRSAKINLSRAKTLSNGRSSSTQKMLQRSISMPIIYRGPAG